MRLALRVLVVVTSLLTIASPAAAGRSPLDPPVDHSAQVDLAYLDLLLYSTPLDSFAAFAAVPRDHWFDWTTDWCSAPLVGNTGRSFDFTKACRRHDFGYRNLRLLDARYGRGRFWTSTQRARVDSVFRVDMRADCGVRPWWEQHTCLNWAEIYFRAVRIGGGP
jgi:Prokaryotic phospholipase A2